MAWPFTTAVAPNYDSLVTLGTSAGTVVTALSVWLLGYRLVNNSGATCLFYWTDTAGTYRFNAYEVVKGGILEAPLNVKPEVGIKAWCDQAAGVTFATFGWS